MKIWSRLGISGVIAAIFYIAGAAFLPHWGFYGAYKWRICMIFLAAGTVLWPVGLTLNARSARQKNGPGDPPDEASAEKEAGNAQRYLLSDLAYWGVMLFVFSVIMMFIAGPTSAPPVLVVAARAKPTNLPVVVNRPAANFPPLKLQGLTYRLPNPSALINGRTYFVGDYVGEAKVTSIEEQRVVLELEGQEKILILGK